MRRKRRASPSICASGAAVLPNSVPEAGVAGMTCLAGSSSQAGPGGADGVPVEGPASGLVGWAFGAVSGVLAALVALAAPDSSFLSQPITRASARAIIRDRVRMIRFLRVVERSVGVLCHKTAGRVNREFPINRYSITDGQVTNDITRSPSSTSPLVGEVDEC